MEAERTNQYFALPNRPVTCVSKNITGLKNNKQTPAISDRCMPDILNMCPVPVRCNSVQSPNVKPVFSPSSNARHHFS